MHTPSREPQLRQRLGIPAEAQQVLIFGESSHWDPNWLYTAEEYFTRFVRDNLDQAIAALQKEPRRIYSVECMFFLRMYWEARPEHHDTIRTFINNGRLRLTSSGVTTADTVIPSTEALLRDLQLGQDWLHTNGMTPQPRLAYFTDSFGCTPTLPAVLNAAGFTQTALTRIDGMYFMGCDLELPSRFPRAGSSAAYLLNHERSLDFVWKDASGAEVLCHWNAFTYGQGDMLAYMGVSRVYLARLAIAMHSDAHVAKRIHQFVAQLAPYRRTPYMFCPIGFDFVEPIPDLTTLLDRYNQLYYPHTGIWVVNAGLDDYLDLVDTHRHELPVVELDPNPYWTGFYTARPTLKQRSRTLVDDLVLAEKLACLPVNRAQATTIAAALAPHWWVAATANHHDFITGTSPDRVVANEQMPWLEHASVAVNHIINQLAPHPSTPHTADQEPPVTWQRHDERIEIRTAHYHMTLNEHAGGAITHLTTPDGRTALIAGQSNDLVSYRDSGGLWRMGLEFAGGVWQASMRTSSMHVPIKISAHTHGLEVFSSVTLDGEVFTQSMWIDPASPVIRCRVVGKTTPGHTVVVHLATGIASDTLVMDAAGGVVRRPATRVYDPTFWPLYQFAHLQDTQSGRGLAVIQPLPGALSYQPDGHVEFVAMRNANRETAYGFIKLPANPATGYETEPYAFEYALVCTAQGDWYANNVDIMARTIPWSPRHDLHPQHLAHAVDTLVHTNNPHVAISAIKLTADGTGMIVRLHTPVVPHHPVQISVADTTVHRAVLCDAREHELQPLPIHAGIITLTMPGTIATIRIDIEATQ